MDIEDKRTPLIGITLKSSVELAEAAYDSGWKGAVLAVAKLVSGNPTSINLALLERLQALPIEPSPSIQKMRAGLE